MDKLFARFNWKTLVLILIALACLVSLLLVFSVFTENREQKKQASLSKKTSQNTQPSSESRTYSDDGISFEYPDNWNVQASPMSGGGTSFAITSPEYGKNLYPKLLLESVSSTQKSAVERGQDFLTYHFSDTPTFFNGIAAHLYEGSFSKELSPDNTPVFASYWVFEKNGKTYTVGYEYSDNAKNIKTETTLRALINTIKIN